MPDPGPLDDPTLVQRCRNGDASAWEALVRRYQRLVYAVARSAGLAEDLAADVFQTVFQRLVQHLPRITEPGRLQAWIVTTTKREAWLQRRRAERLVSMTASDADGDPAGRTDEWTCQRTASRPTRARPTAVSRLSRVGYFIYYRADAADLKVLAFWHGSRGSQPVV